ncbi:unnamed protein product, partial [Amoebophrya sp. A120]|eukprot:GSA120T00026113001.1
MLDGPSKAPDASEAPPAPVTEETVARLEAAAERLLHMPTVVRPQVLQRPGSGMSGGSAGVSTSSPSQPHSPTRPQVVQHLKDELDAIESGVKTLLQKKMLISSTNGNNSSHSSPEVSRSRIENTPDTMIVQRHDPHGLANAGEGVPRPVEELGDAEVPKNGVVLASDHEVYSAPDRLPLMRCPESADVVVSDGTTTRGRGGKNAPSEEVEAKHLVEQEVPTNSVTQRQDVNNAGQSPSSS